MQLMISRAQIVAFLVLPELLARVPSMEPANTAPSTSLSISRKRTVTARVISGAAGRGRLFGKPVRVFVMSSTVHRLNIARLCNEAVDDVVGSAEKALMMAAAAQKLEELFDVLHIDHRNDHNMRDTPRRVAKMFVEESCTAATMRRRRSPNSRTSTATTS